MSPTSIILASLAILMVGMVLGEGVGWVIRRLRVRRRACAGPGPHRDRQTLYVVRGPINTILLCAGCKGRREGILNAGFGRKSEVKKNEGLRSAPPKALLAYHQN